MLGIACALVVGTACVAEPALPEDLASEHPAPDGPKADDASFGWTCGHYDVGLLGAEYEVDTHEGATLGEARAACRAHQPSLLQDCDRCVPRSAPEVPAAWTCVHEELDLLGQLYEVDRHVGESYWEAFDACASHAPGLSQGCDRCFAAE